MKTPRKHASYRPGATLLVLLSLTGCAVSGLTAQTAPLATTPAPVLPVSLGSAGHFVILAKAGISTVPTSVITGDIGVSPIAASAITGFALIADASNGFATSAQVTGKIYAANYAAPTPSYMTTAVSDMQLAFTDAAGRAANVTELGAGNIGGLTLTPGVYKWSTGLLIPTDVTLTGTATDVWIFEIAQDLNLSNGTKVVLAGGALASNIFWQVSGAVHVGTTAHLEGVVLSQTAVTMGTGSSLNGRLLAQTAVTLDASTVSAGASVIAPRVLSSTPLDGATGALLSARVSGTFDMVMDPASLTPSTFTLASGLAATPVPGTVSYANSTAVFLPTAQLNPSESYTATITTGARSASGPALAANRSWGFTTVAGNPTVPTVLANTPLDGATGVAPSETASATFSEAMDAATLTSSTFTLTSGAGAVPVQGTVAYANATAVFVPSLPLPAGSTYAATITTGARSAFGVALAANRAWQFTTASNVPTVPTLLSSLPLDGATNVLINGNASATFSEPMDPASLSAATFTLTSAMGGMMVPVAGTVSCTNSIATFQPAGPLANNGLYTAMITTGATSALGVPLATSRSWSFTCGPMSIGRTVNLGTAGNYVILAKTGISTVPDSVITGDIGVSPITSGAITGFSLIADASNAFSTSLQVSGKVYAAEYAVPTPASLTAAVSDMQLAFTEAAGRTADVTELGAGNIGGMTLAPGVYKWSSGVLIPTDVTLTGSATDTWIFEVAQTLTMGSATRIILAGGALPKNIFWQVSGAVVLGTTAHMEGVILGQTGVTLATGASINGRVLAQTAVTLDHATVTQPAL